jgi:hypothetical protein
MTQFPMQQACNNSFKLLYHLFHFWSILYILFVCRFFANLNDFTFYAKRSKCSLAIFILWLLHLCMHLKQRKLWSDLYVNFWITGGKALFEIKGLSWYSTWHHCAVSDCFYDLLTRCGEDRAVY